MPFLLCRYSICFSFLFRELMSLVMHSTSLHIEITIYSFSFFFPLFKKKKKKFNFKNQGQMLTTISNWSRFSAYIYCSHLPYKVAHLVNWQTALSSILFWLIDFCCYRYLNCISCSDWDKSEFIGLAACSWWSSILFLLEALPGHLQ